MATNLAENTIGTSLWYADSDSMEPNWIKLPDIKAFPALGGSPETIEATTLADSFQKNVLGVQAIDGFEFPMNYNASDYETIKQLKGQTKQFKLNFKDIAEVTWTGEASCWISSGEVNGVKEMVFYTSVLTEPQHSLRP